MKILIHGINFSPEITGIGKYTGEMADWLVRHGHEVRAVSAPPYYPEWVLNDKYHPWSYGKEELFGVSVWRSPVWVPRQPRGATRLIHLASFATSSLPLMAAQIPWKPDIVFVVAPALFCAASALALAESTGAVSCLHIQDFEVDAAFDMGIIKSNVLKSLAYRVEKKLLAQFDWVSSISPRMVEKLIDKGVAKDKAHLFKNWVDCDQIKPLDRASKYRKELRISNEKVIAMYSGAMGEKQGVELIIFAAQKLISNRKLLFIVAGSGPAFERFKTLTQWLPNLRCLPLQPLERLNEWLNLADIHLMPQKSSAADLVMPSKLTGMAASGKPIVAIADEDTELGRAVSGIGIVAKPESGDDFVQAIVALADAPTKRSVLGKKARRFALEEYQQDVVMKKLENDLEAAIASKRIP